MRLTRTEWVSPRRLLPPLTLAIAALILWAGVPAAEAAQRCGRILVPARHVDAKVRVLRGPVSCATAHRLLKNAFDIETTHHWNGDDPTFGIFWKVQGWRCFIGLAGSQTFCRRGPMEVDGSLRTDDGWNF